MGMIRWLAPGIAFMLAVALPLLAPGVTQGQGRLKVVTTVAPLTNIALNVGGARIDLEGIIPAGVNSHTFEPSPSDAVKLAAADLVIVNGLSLEGTVIELAEANLKSGARIVSLGESTINRDEWIFDFSFPEENGEPNPHLWTNPPMARQYGQVVATFIGAGLAGVVAGIIPAWRGARLKVLDAISYE